MYDTSARILRFADVAEDPTVCSARSTLQLETAVTKVAHDSMAAVRARLSTQARNTLAAYEPSLPSDDVAFIRTFVSDAIALALPQTTYAVETLMGPVMRFVHWSVFVVGCELDSTIVFNRDLIDRFVREALPGNPAPGTRRNYRAWILRVAEVVNPDKVPHTPIPLNSKSMESPYTERDIIALDRWASGQTTQYMRTGAAILLALGAGAGLHSVEVAHLKRDAVTVDDDGTVSIAVSVAGEFKRRIVVTSEFEDIIAAQVKALPENAFVFLPKRTRVENDVVSAFVGRTSRPAGALTVTVRRLRNTWLVTQMTNRVDVQTLMDAAGLLSLESISRLAQFVPRPTDSDRDAQLRGEL